VSWFLRSMDVVVCAPRPLRIALPDGVDPPDSRPDLPAVLPRQKRPLNRVPRSPGRPLVERRPAKFLAADRVPEKYSREKGETNGLK
jgi:hypothetical protein